MDKFQLVSDYRPSGDQPEAIAGLTNGVNWGLREQTLLGVTGSGKTFTMASVIANLNRPTLVLAHNKTLAAQLCSEFREFFPNNAVEYFISSSMYFDGGGKAIWVSLMYRAYFILRLLLAFGRQVFVCHGKLGKRPPAVGLHGDVCAGLQGDLRGSGLGGGGGGESVI